VANVIAVIGAQWGDEGKGKIVDLLAERFDIVARYQGGHNAGHSVQVGDQSFVLHLLPSGIVHRGKTCVLGNGMVIDPKAFFVEADRLVQQGIEVSPERVKISSRAHLILPYHRALDHTSEERLGNEKVGTTLRGIGPAYEDKAGRRGIRTADALVPDVLRSRIERNLEDANRIIEAYGGERLDADEIFKEMSVYTERLAPFIADTTHYLNIAATEGRSILLEGAQATLLDVDHGTYPFVTSSNTVAGTTGSGSGMGPNAAGFVLGIVKAYTTRVGSGPFPTELDDEIGQRLGERGHEFGTVTGRQRRCGWFDAVLVGQSAAVSGITGIALTKIDVLDGMETVKICTGYRIGDQVYDYLPPHSADQARAEPIYEEMDGWSGTTAGARSWADLPAQAIKYVRRIEELIRCPVALVSTSPQRDDTILVSDPFAG